MHLLSSELSDLKNEVFSLELIIMSVELIIAVSLIRHIHKIPLCLQKCNTSITRVGGGMWHLWRPT